MKSKNQRYETEAVKVETTETGLADVGTILRRRLHRRIFHDIFRQKKAYYEDFKKNNIIESQLGVLNTMSGMIPGYEDCEWFLREAQAMGFHELATKAESEMNYIIEEDTAFAVSN